MVKKMAKDDSGTFNGVRCGGHNMMKKVLFASFGFNLITTGLLLSIVLFMNGASNANDEKIEKKTEKIDNRQQEIKDSLSDIKADIKVIKSIVEKLG